MAVTFVLLYCSHMEFNIVIDNKSITELIDTLENKSLVSMYDIYWFHITTSEIS